MSKDQSNFILKLFTHKTAIIKAIVVLIILAAAVTIYIGKSAAEKDNGIIISHGDAVLAAGSEEENDSQNQNQDKSNRLDAAHTDQQPDQSGYQAIATAGNNETIVVDVSGAVRAPTVVIMPAGSRVYEAIEKAGGLTEEADLRNINRAIVLNDGDRLYIPTKKEIETEAELPSKVATDSNRGLSDASGAAKTSGTERTASASVNAQGANSAQGGGADKGGGQSGLVNINTADVQELQKLNGVGPAIADRIITYRNNNGNFKTIDDLKKISGIGVKTFDKFKDKITV